MSASWHGEEDGGWREKGVKPGCRGPWLTMSHRQAQNNGAGMDKADARGFWQWVHEKNVPAGKVRNRE